MFRGCFGRSKDDSEARNTVHPTKGTLSNSSPKRVHVTFGESKRVLCFSEEDEVGELRQNFLQAFSDSLSDDTTVANVRFQQYDHTFKEYVDIENEVKLENNAKVKAVITSFRENKETDCGGGFIPLPVNLNIPLYDILGALPKDVRYHTIKKDVPYRLWNLVSHGLIQSMPDNQSVVTCNGKFGENNTVLKAKFYGRDRRDQSHLYYLVYTKGLSTFPSDMYLTAKGDNGEITLEPAESDAAVFKPIYYYGFTAFMSDWESLYLGCDNNLNAKLVKMEDVNYPNPQALFAANKYQGLPTKGQN